MKKGVLPINALLLIILALVWGSSYILMKKGLLAFSALQVSMLRIVFASVALLPFVPKALKNINKRDLLFALLVAILGSAIPTYLYPVAITKVDSSVTGIINTLTPIFTMLFGWAFFKMKPTLAKIAGLIIALGGASFLVLKANGTENLSISFYALIAVLATVCYGFSSNILKSKLNHVNAIQLTALTFFLIGPFALIILLSTDFVSVAYTHPASSMSLLYIAILGVIGTAAALVLFNLLIKRTDALYASSVTFLMPIIILLWGYLDGEAIGVAHFVGLVCILTGVYLTSRKS